jgi:hypothetical protein
MYDRSRCICDSVGSSFRPGKEMVKWKEAYALLAGLEATVGPLPVSIFPVSSATRALILATRDSMAISHQFLDQNITD